MQKLKITPTQFVSTVKPEAKYVLHLAEVSNCLVARYFSVLDQTEVDPANENVLSELVPFDPTSTPILRQVVTERSFYEAAAVSSDVRLADKFLLEIGRHIFRPTIGAETVVGFGERSDFALFVFPFGSNARVQEPYNHFAVSASIKGTLARDGRLRDGQPMLFLYSDVATAPMANWTLGYADCAPFVLVDTTAGGWTSVSNDFSFVSLLPQAILTSAQSLAPGAVVDVVVDLKRNNVLTNYTGELVVEAVSGYVPNTRIQITNGSGVFKVMALGLVAGDAVRVKVGTKVLSGMAEITIPVV